ncbi:BnaC09g36000D [Brassica napus]|uniref:BnaC09g36000D protein n=1 Tax=Brassica napus TaxID=3708 RepID=A0A078GQR6_BRANA|nr:BnaC09g36000D [Brassica napus]
MSSNGKSTLSGDSRSEKPKGPTGTPYVSSGLSIGDPHSKTAKGQTSVSSGLTKPIGKNPNGTIIHTTKTGASSGVRGKAAVSSSVRGKAIVSADVGEVMAFKDVIFGLEMLLIDQEETVIQGFIPAGRIETYLPHMKAGGIYRLNSFFGSNNKTLYRVADPSVTITFSSTYVLSDLEDSLVCFPEDRFRFRGHEEFDAACDLRGDLYGKSSLLYRIMFSLILDDVLSDSIMLDDAEIASSRRVLLHVQTHDGPVMKLYLWDKAAFDFSEKIKASGGTACALALSSMTSSRIFLDSDVKATRDYLTWLNSNLAVANRVDAAVVTKTETVAWFECIATIGDFAHGSTWYYIGCGVCHTKATKGPTTLMCKKCGKSNIVGVAQISVYDNDDQASFVLFGDDGHELTGKKASELVESYSVVLTPEVPELEGNLVGNVIDDPSTCFEESDGQGVKRATDNVEVEDLKRAKCG